MKTDQLMEVRFPLGVLHVYHLSAFGDLAEVFQIGNAHRLKEGKPSLSMQAWLQRRDVKEYIEFVSQQIGEPALRRRRGRGKGSGTWAHLFIMLDAASALSPALKFEMHKLFVEHKALELRDRSGDAFIDLNAMLALQANDVLGKPAHKGHYVTLANIIRERILGPDAGPKAWNQATPEQLRERTRIEEALTTMLKAGVVRDWDHLKELAKIV